MHKAIYSIASPISRQHMPSPYNGGCPGYNVHPGQHHMNNAPEVREQQSMQSAWYGVMSRLGLNQYAQHPVIYFRLSAMEAAMLSGMIGGFTLSLVNEVNAHCIIDAKNIRAMEAALNCAQAILKEREAEKEEESA